MIADDHAIVREGLRWLLETEPGMTLVGEARDGAEAIALVDRLDPDVILMDLVMPRVDGIAAINEIRTRHAGARILVLTSFAEDEQIFPAIKAGAMGYLLKDTSPQALLQAIRDVHAGTPTMHPIVARKLIEELRGPPKLPPTTEPLTDREMDVLKLVARGLSNEDIAKQLFVTERTARTHVSNILRKLHVANRTQAALYALREGLARLDEAGTEDQ
ncbi:MAG: response regulator transcription factor [Anaerolineae bacterium]|nr:response regulator transcription factor [Anaerolineae bacterium]